MPGVNRLAGIKPFYRAAGLYSNSAIKSTIISRAIATSEHSPEHTRLCDIGYFLRADMPSALLINYPAFASRRLTILVSRPMSFGFFKNASAPARHASASTSTAESMMTGVRLRCGSCRARRISSTPLTCGKSLSKSSRSKCSLPSSILNAVIPFTQVTTLKPFHLQSVSHGVGDDLAVLDV